MDVWKWPTAPSLRCTKMSAFEGQADPILPRITMAAAERSVAIRFPKQLWQPRYVDGDPPRLVLRQHLRLSCFGFVFAAVEVRPGFLTLSQSRDGPDR